METKPVLVTGGTGYVGGRLIPRLLSSGYRVRAMVRSPQRLLARPWGQHAALEIVRGDALDRNVFVEAGAGCGAAFYLIHSMNSRTGRFAEADRQAAANMVACAEHNDLLRIIYLGGLGDKNDRRLSNHLRSRYEVEVILKAGRVPVTVLRAAMILGAGSAAFEMLRYLVDRLPIMITPRWVRTPCQPIAIANVLDYLAGCLEAPAAQGRTLDIGGPDILSYEKLIQLYCAAAGLRRRVILPLPFLTPRLSARWIHLVTPVPASIARPLAEGLSIPVVCRNNDIRQMVAVSLISCQEAIRIALERIAQEQVDTCCFDGGGRLPPEWVTCGDADYAGGTILRRGYRLDFEGDALRLWQTVEGIGGRHGWYYGHALWRLRGMLDRLAGGPGLGRGRRHSQHLRIGDALDFWRVVDLQPPQRLLLLAEMRSPGDALLECLIHSEPGNRVRLELISRFLPKGLAGLAYWYGLLPIHDWLFKGTLTQLVARSQGRWFKGPKTFKVMTPPQCRI